jgi:heme/copper-type cytochrome/quinol oxidase subunit 2
MRSREETNAVRHGIAEKIFHKLARMFTGLHWVVGITTLPATATAREERSFVLMWLGIIVFIILFVAVLVYLVGHI